METLLIIIGVIIGYALLMGIGVALLAIIGSFFMKLLGLSFEDKPNNFQQRTSTSIISSKTDSNQTATNRAERTDVNNYYTQNNIYLQQNNYNKPINSKHTNQVERIGTTYQVHTSESGLAKKLLNNTGSKRIAKDILVDQYGYSQNEAKSLAGYRGY